MCSQRGPSFRGRAGFTLVELLVVVAIIALLIALLLPALSGARRAGQTARCLANFHTLGTAQQLYANAYKDALVDAALAHGGLGNPRQSWSFIFRELIGGSLVLHSPVDRSVLWPVDEGGSSAAMSFDQYLRAYDASPDSPPTAPLARWTSYGLNDFVTRSKAPPIEFTNNHSFETLSKVPRPSATVQWLVMTFGNYGPQSVQFAVSDHVHSFNWSDGPPRSQADTASKESEIAAHGGKLGSFAGLSNYGFLDGHAATLKFEDVYLDAQHNKFYPEVAR
ncbi:MAG: prepilin-type N-terminal cleavage/methylation domain-containing protein [Phycisphaerales bacterium]